MKLPWKYILVSLAIGLLLGATAGFYTSKHYLPAWKKKSPKIFLERLHHELNLSETQRTQILTLLNTNHEKMNAFEDELRKTTRAQIRTVLTPAQQPGFEAMIARHDAKRQKQQGTP